VNVPYLITGIWQVVSTENIIISDITLKFKEYLKPPSVADLGDFLVIFEVIPENMVKSL
jgi:hypothetical protein